MLYSSLFTGGFLKFVVRNKVMKNKNIRELVKVESLSYRKELIYELTKDLYSDTIDIYCSEIRNENVTCPHCDGEKVYKHGKYKGRRRFHCKCCDKTFNDQTGTSIAGIHKRELWCEFIEMTLESKSIRDIAKKLKLSRQTVLDWRHKVLTSLESIFSKKYNGIVEMDDCYIRFNQKGRKTDFLEHKRVKKTGKKTQGISRFQTCVLFTTDRNGVFDAKLAKVGKINLPSLRRIVDTSRFNHNLICSDSDKSLLSWLKSSKFQFQDITASGNRYVINGIYHVQHVNNLMNRFERWLEYHFSTVSTKYLRNYLIYFQMLSVLKFEKDSMGKFLKYSLTDTDTIARNKMHEQRYQKFLNY